MVIRALSNLTLSISSGERVAVCGHNGAGKTSLLRMIAGVHQPTAGSIIVSGRVASMLNISLGMDQESTGFENIRLSGLVHGLSPREITRMSQSIAEFSDLGEYLSLPVRVYSSGMLMRLAFSVISSIEADIVLMDEWLGVGDTEFAERAERRLRSVVDRAKILVLATHNEAFARLVCNRIVTMEHGRIVSDSSVG